MPPKIIRFSQLWELLPLQVIAEQDLEQDEWICNLLTFSYSSYSKELSLAYERLNYQIIRRLEIDCGSESWNVTVEFQSLMEFWKFGDRAEITKVFISYSEATNQMIVAEVGGEMVALVDEGEVVEIDLIPPDEIVSEFSFKANEGGLAIAHCASLNLIGEARKVYFNFFGRSQNLVLEAFSPTQWSELSLNASDGIDVRFGLDWEIVWDLFSCYPEEVTATVSNKAILLESEKVSVFAHLSHFGQTIEPLRSVRYNIPTGDPIAVSYENLIITVNKFCQPFYADRSDRSNLVTFAVNKSLHVTNCQGEKKSLPSMWGKHSSRQERQETVKATICGFQLLDIAKYLPQMERCCIRVSKSGIVFSGFNFPFRSWILGVSENEQPESQALDLIPMPLQEKADREPTIEPVEPSLIDLYDRLKNELRQLIFEADLLTEDRKTSELQKLDKQWEAFFGSQPIPRNLNVSCLEAMLWFKERYEIALNKAIGGKVLFQYKFKAAKNAKQIFEEVCFMMSIE